MTKREIINTWLASINRTRVSGDTAEPLMPFLLGDAIYTIYNKDVAPLDLHREEKKLRSDWAAAYDRFNKPFFKAFDQDTSIQVTALMDDFENYIQNDLMVLRSQLMLLLQDIEFELRGTIVSLLLCHVLAQCAQHAWGNVYRVGKKMGPMLIHKGEKNRDLETINRAAFLLANRMHNAINQAFVDPNKTEGIPPAVNALCRRIYRWLQEN